jgi:hypothetical protein
MWREGVGVGVRVGVGGVGVGGVGVGGVGVGGVGVGGVGVGGVEGCVGRKATHVDPRWPDQVLRMITIGWRLTFETRWSKSGAGGKAVCSTSF